jgi:diguanylate cyclase (GGDEF)-like protein
MPASESQYDSLQSIIEPPSAPASAAFDAPVHAARASVARIVGPFVLALIVLTAFSTLSLEVIMAMRAYGYGENLWVKNQKVATLQLLHYSHTGDPAAITTLNTSISVHQNFDAARRALVAYDANSAHAKLIAAGVPENDASKAVWANTWFGWSAQHRRIIETWGRADAVLSTIDTLKAEVIAARGTGDSARLLESQRAVMALDRKIIPLALEFSSNLADTSYAVYTTLWIGAILLATGLGAAIVLRTRGLWRAHGKVEKELDGERQRASITLASIGDAVVSLDKNGGVTYMNEAARSLTQCTADVCLDSPGSPQILKILEKDTGRSVDIVGLATDFGASQRAKSETDHVLSRADGKFIPVAWVASPIRTRGEGPEGAVIVLRNVSREQRLVGRLTWMATHDPLTRLPNRRAFEERLNSALVRLRSSGSESQHVAMLFDLDQFKIVNDTSGHPAGDELLRLVATAARAQLREQDTLARMGGDEFAVLLLDCPSDVGERKAEEIRRAIQAVRLEWQGRIYADVTASIGLVHIRANQIQDSASVLSAADVACYLAKDRGRDQVSVYQQDEDELRARHGDMAWPQRLRDAVASGRLELYSQTYRGIQADTAGARRCELLLRLRDEHGKLVPPGDFIPAAERYGMMPMIDRWVVDNALQLISRLQGDHAHATIYSINLSGSAFGDEAFLSGVLHLFEQHGVSYPQVCFEITETQAVSDLQSAARFIGVLREKGASFALDDFGSGMSSMNYLKHLPVDYLKIDGRLVRDMVVDPVNHAMVQMIAHLAKTLGIRTVGEFAESAAIIDALRDVGVDYAQGYGVAKPKPFVEFLAESGTTVRC